MKGNGLSEFLLKLISKLINILDLRQLQKNLNHGCPLGADGKQQSQKSFKDYIFLCAKVPYIF